MVDEVRIQHVFRDEATGFCDAIVLPREDYDALPELEIEAIKTARLQNWKDALNAPQPEPDPKAEAQALADEVAALEDRLAVASAELAVKVEALPVKDRPKVVAEAVAEVI